MKKFILSVMVALLLLGCAASASKINGVKLGMGRGTVLEIMGEPSSTSETEGVLFLRYRLRDGFTSDDYFIRFIDGKVDAYGRFGEFGLGY